MPVPQLAEALYEAHQQRSTGWLKVMAEGRQSELLLDRGNLVGAEIRTGHRSLAQSLLLRGLIDPPMLDSLWADGQGAGPRALEDLGVEWTQACEVQVLAQIERLSAKATSVQFEAGKVSSAFSPIPGERAVRAAWLPNGEIETEGAMFRCVDPERCERWLLSEDEQRFVRGFESFKPLSGASPAQRALLELLSREGAVERAEKPAPAEDPGEISWADLLDDDPPAERTGGTDARTLRAEPGPTVPRADLAQSSPSAEAAPPVVAAHAAEVIPSADAGEAVPSAEADQRVAPAHAVEAVRSANAGGAVPSAEAAERVTSAHAVEAVRSVNAGEAVLSAASAERVTSAPAAEAITSADGGEAVPSAASAERVASAHATEAITSADGGEAVPSAASERVASAPAAEAIPSANAAEAVRSSEAVEAAASADRAQVSLSIEAVEILSAISSENEAQSMRAARARAERELISEMDEALRRSSSATIEDWFSDESILRPSRPGIADPTDLTVPSFVPAAPDSPREANPPLSQPQSAVESEPELIPIIDVIIDEEAPPAGSDPLDPGRDTAVVIASGDTGRTETSGQAPGQSLARKTWQLNEEHVADDPSDPQEAARLRRQRLLRRAMENMGGFGGRASEASGSEAVSPPEEPAPPQVQTSAQPAPSSDEMALVTALEKKFYEIESGADHFAVLGVPRTATADEVKAAFVELAKVFHPDRLPESLRHLAGKTRAIFEAVRVAYETLQNESRRGTYEATVRAEKPPPKTTNPAEEASDASKRADILLRKRDYAAAEHGYHQAFLIDPKATYLAAEAWAIYMDPNRRDQAARAKQMMADAAKKDPNCDRAHYQLGVIARVEGDMDRAEKHFREAVRLNPKHPEANQELRLIQMRRKKGVIR